MTNSKYNNQRPTGCTLLGVIVVLFTVVAIGYVEWLAFGYIVGLFDAG